MIIIVPPRLLKIFVFKLKGNFATFLAVLVFIKSEKVQHALNLFNVCAYMYLKLMTYLFYDIISVFLH